MLHQFNECKRGVNLINRQLYKFFLCYSVMPKKKTNSKSKNSKSKKKIEIKIDESILEKEIKETEKEEEKEEVESRQEEFNEFIESSPKIASSSPVLEKVRAIEKVPEIELPQVQQDKTETRRINYVISNEPKYSTLRREEDPDEKKYESVFIPPVLSRREIRASMRQEFLSPTERLMADENNPSLRFIEWENFDDAARLPFEKNEKKYKKFRL